MNCEPSVLAKPGYLDAAQEWQESKLVNVTPHKFGMCMTSKSMTSLKPFQSFSGMLCYAVYNWGYSNYV